MVMQNLKPPSRVDLTGELRRADLDQRVISLRLDDGRVATVLFSQLQEAMFLEFLRAHDKMRLHVVGYATHDPDPNADICLTSIESLEVASAAAPQNTLWQNLAELTASIPEAEWQQIPADLAKTHKSRLRVTGKTR